MANIPILGTLVKGTQGARISDDLLPGDNHLWRAIDVINERLIGMEPPQSIQVRCGYSVDEVFTEEELFTVGNTVDGVTLPPLTADVDAVSRDTGYLGFWLPGDAADALLSAFSANMGRITIGVEQFESADLAVGGTLGQVLKRRLSLTRYPGRIFHFALDASALSAVRYLFVSSDTSFRKGGIISSPFSGDSVVVPDNTFLADEDTYIAIGKPTAQGLQTRVFYPPSDADTFSSDGWVAVDDAITINGTSISLIRRGAAITTAFNGRTIRTT